MKPFTSAIAIAVVLSCFALPGLGAQEREVPGSQPASQQAKTARQAKADKQATGSREALALAHRVRAFAGGRTSKTPKRNIVFTVDSGQGQQRLFWDRATARLRVETLKRPKGKRLGLSSPDVRVFDLALDKDLLIEPAPPKQAPKIYGRVHWYRDAFWLLAPFKILDAGMRLEIEPRQPKDTEGVRRLRVDVSHNPDMKGNHSVYVMHVEEASGKILLWDQYSSPTSKRKRTWKFEDYRLAAKLMVATTHREIRPKQSQLSPQLIRLLDIAVDVDAPKDIWTARKPLLTTLGKPKPAASTKPTTRPIR